jgi:alkylation response protein AidB-like acyl-CoA dehydrogenase
VSLDDIDDGPDARDGGPDAGNGGSLPDLEEYRALARAWLAEHLPRRGDAAPAGEADPGHTLDASRARQRSLFEGGYAGISWPARYGGQGLPRHYEVAFLAEAAGFWLPDFGPLGATTFQICVPTMLRHGSPEFLQEFVPSVLAGEALVCQFFSEPSSGSDLAGIRTRATRDGERWVISGRKLWSTHAHLADWGMCLARTDWDVPKHRGLTWFAVPCDAPGLTITRLRQIDGSHGFCEESFDDVVVPDAQRIGEVNQGWTVTQSMLVLERGAGRPDDELPLGGPGPLAPDLVQLAKRAGRIADPVVQQKIVAAHTIDFVGRVLGARIGALLRAGRLDPACAAYGKLFRGTYNPVRARLAVEIGGAGAMAWAAADDDGPATALAYLGARAASIAGGTNEMQRNVIAERVLGLPREPSVDTDVPFHEVVRRAARWESDR